MLSLLLAGMSHRTAPVEIRERVALPAEAIQRLLEEGGARFPELETFAVVSTCNRTEIYAVAERGRAEPARLLDVLGAARPAVREVAPAHWYFLKDLEMVRHVFRVTAGLDSMMVGENQILAQVREGYRLYSETGASHPLFNKMFHQAFSCGKRVRTETRLGEGAVSVAYAGVELAMKIFGSLESKTALLVGAGETGLLAARHLMKKELKRLLITNRTLSRAVAAADELGGEARPYEELGRTIGEADVVVLCVEAPEYIVTAPLLGETLARRGGGRPLFLIDLGVPRNADPACNRLNNVFLYDIDALQKLAQSNVERRKNEIPLAEQIVEEMAGEFIHWFRSLRVESTIRSLMTHTEEVRQQVLEKNRKFIKPEQAKDVDALTRALVKQIFHGPLERLKEYDANMKHGMTRLATIQELFDLKVEEANDDAENRNAPE